MKLTPIKLLLVLPSKESDLVMPQKCPDMDLESEILEIGLLSKLNMLNYKPEWKNNIMLLYKTN